MQYALVDGLRSEAFRGGRGACPICGANTIAKCGERVVDHWAHASRRDCDPWWENETPWHRAWKARFPTECHEIAHVADDGEVHRADIKTPTGIVVEIQNSPISDTERRSREAFYGNLVWVVNGVPFRDQFHILHHLPDPASELARDLVWFKAKREEHGTSNGMFWRRSKNPDRLAGLTNMVEVESMHRCEDEILATYCGHHQYDWIRPRAGWLETACPVYIDFGDDFLWRLDRYGDSKLPCIHTVAKAKFVHDAMTELEAKAIATRFYPIRHPAS